MSFEVPTEISKEQLDRFRVSSMGHNSDWSYSLHIVDLINKFRHFIDPVDLAIAKSAGVCEALLGFTISFDGGPIYKIENNLCQLYFGNDDLEKISKSVYRHLRNRDADPIDLSFGTFTVTSPELDPARHIMQFTGNPLAGQTENYVMQFSPDVGVGEFSKFDSLLYHAKRLSNCREQGMLQQFEPFAQDI